MRGYVYILTNESMPGLVKIGRTTRSVEQRINELYQTGVPQPFVAYASVYSPDCAQLEIMVHDCLTKKRLSSGREFFSCNVSDAIQAVEDCHREQLENWVEDFLPDHNLVPCDDFVDTGGFADSVYRAMDKSLLYPPDLPQLILEISGSEMSPAIERLEKKRALAKEKYLKDKAEKSVVDLVQPKQFGAQI